MKIPTNDLYASIRTLERIMSERDDDRAQLFDRAERDECAEWEAYRLQLEEEREEALAAALDECLKLGLDREHLKVLVLESQATGWGLKHSLKG